MEADHAYDSVLSGSSNSHRLRLIEGLLAWEHGDTTSGEEAHALHGPARRFRDRSLHGTPNPASVPHHLRVELVQLGGTG